MGNIVNDIVDEVNIKPNKTKQIIKIVVSVACSLIVLAFAFGQFKSSFFNRMDSLEEKVDKQTIAVEQLSTDMNAGFDAVDTKIDKIYSDGLTIFNNFQEYNDAQLEDGREVSIAVTSLRDEPFMNEAISIEVETNDTIFHITGALKRYYESIDKNKYEVGALTNSQKYPNRYDFAYRNKR